MHTFLASLGLLTLLCSSFASPVLHSQPRPLVLWHGLGDSYNAPGVLEFIEEMKGVHPGLFVHSVHLAEKLEDDRKAGYFGNANQQLDEVFHQLQDVPELRGGFDAMGFSQGGQFLRAYVERYNSPPVHNLITFGSQHMGVADLPHCESSRLFCFLYRRVTKNGIYTKAVQETVVPAQYYRDPNQLALYLERNHFLTDINNEHPDAVNTTYADNLKSINKLVLVLFAKDRVAVPKETSWFGSYAPQDPLAPNAEQTLIPMRQQSLYVNDTIGLRSLDERGDVVFETCDGDHMDLGECWRPIVEKYVGGLVGSQIEGVLAEAEHHIQTPVYL